MTPPPKIAHYQLLFPGPEGWELWTFDENGTPAAPQSKGLAPGFEGAASSRILALPVASTYSIPLWVFGQNDAELRGAAHLHLEKDGLIRPEEPSGFDLERILTQDKRVLIRVDALAKSGLTLRDGSFSPDVVCLAPRLLPLSDGRIVIWKELGKFVTAITRNGKLIYHNVIASPRFDAKAAEEVVRWAKQFQFQGMVEPFRGITVWTSGIDLKAIQAKTGLPVVEEDPPIPRFESGAACAIVPGFVLELRRLEARKVRNRRLLRAGAALAAAIVLGFLAVIALGLQTQRKLLDRIAALSPAASEIEQIQQRWAEVAPAVDPDRSPLEMMLLIHGLPSASEVSLTRFERGADRLAIKGRATSPSEALKFLGAISKSNQLSQYHWTYTQPLIAQDGTATFEIEGILSSATQ